MFHRIGVEAGSFVSHPLQTIPVSSTGGDLDSLGFTIHDELRRDSMPEASFLKRNAPLRRSRSLEEKSRRKTDRNGNVSSITLLPKYE